MLHSAPTCEGLKYNPLESLEKVGVLYARWCIVLHSNSSLSRSVAIRSPDGIQITPHFPGTKSMGVSPLNGIERAPHFPGIKHQQNPALATHSNRDDKCQHGSDVMDSFKPLVCTKRRAGHAKETPKNVTCEWKTGFNLQNAQVLTCWMDKHFANQVYASQPGVANSLTIAATISWLTQLAALLTAP
eukprot:1161025-Pelagomonas_calceolata.AAC.2